VRTMARMLIIDNEPNMRRIVATILKRAGYETAEREAPSRASSAF